MTFIQDILKVEDEAKKIVERAHLDLKDSISLAKKHQKETIANTITTIAENKSHKISEQKNTLADIYKKTYSKEEKNISRIEQRAQTNHTKALAKVLSSIID